MKRFFFLIFASLLTIRAFAGAGFFNTLFGDGDQHFVCYSRIHRNFYLGIFFAVLILGFLAWSRYRLKKKTADELAKQKAIIEEQNKDILDSIRYASRMQEALKPETEILKSILPQSFFFLKPRDIVSGDFYFVEELNGKVIVAAVDCTGHGVPGAFLTFIGNNALRHAIEVLGPDDPSMLLDRMNEEVKKTLGQKRAQNELNDGMEIGLCIYDKQTKTLEYAGAGCPLYIFRNGEMEEIKAAKCTVGSIQEHVKEAPPSHRFQLSDGDAFYLSSDGLADQFGGSEGKKFRREEVRKLIRGIYPLDASDQLKKVEQAVSGWMGNHSQTDDMLLIGIKV